MGGWHVARGWYVLPLSDALLCHPDWFVFPSTCSLLGSTPPLGLASLYRGLVRVCVWHLDCA